MAKENAWPLLSGVRMSLKTVYNEKHEKRTPILASLTCHRRDKRARICRPKEKRDYLMEL